MSETCRSCGAPVRWALHERTRKAAPLEVDPAGDWMIVVERATTLDGEVERDVYRRAPEGVVPRYTNHYATCPQAATWRSRTREGDR